MPLARKIILHAPVSSVAKLEEFVEACLRDNVSLIAIIGPACADLEETIDWIVVGDGSDQGRFICTSSHPDEPLDDVINFVEYWEIERNDPYQIVRI